MNELTLAIKQNPGTIEMNFDALEEQLDKKLDEYRGAVFTEDTKTIAKAEIASLRRLKKDIEDGRKTVKKKWMEPYDAFDKRIRCSVRKNESTDASFCSVIKKTPEKRLSGFYRGGVTSCDQ